jgi:ABC-type Na+ efflux pump permease subunit
MTSSDVARADRISRSCSIIMTLGAVALIVSCLLNLADDRIAITPMRASFWGLSMLLWLTLLATGGGLLLSRKVRAILNDELTLANRARAVQTGFWTAMAATLALYAFSFVRPLPVREALNLIATAAIAASLLRFAWLEHR